jgi:2-polyprenyl-3-methyl-5-hydroxy-6-metoxy-1,4-benzoquinol methylase
MKSTTDYSNVNLHDPRQDIHLVRPENPALNRYKIAESLLPPNVAGSKIVEIGGGAAEFSRRLKALNINVTFTDLSETNIQRATELGFEAHRVDLNLGLPGLADNSFDGAVMLEIIEHVVGAEHLLSEVARVLRPGGFLILSTPNFSSWQNRLRILSGNLSHDEGYHFRFFNPKVLRQRVEAAGLRVDRTVSTAPFYGYNLILNRVLGKPRRHLRVPNITASILGETMFVRARKPQA